MGFHWTKNSIKWFHDSAIHTDFYKKLVIIISENISKDSEIMDLGCGLGFLTRDLIEAGYKVLAVDSSKEIKKYWDDNFKEFSEEVFVSKSEEEIFIHCKKDILLMSFYGRIKNHETLYHYLNKCNDTLVYIVKAKKGSSIFPEGKSKRHKVVGSNLKDLLDEEGLSYKSYIVDSVFDQYLDSLEEGVKFVSHYYPFNSKEEIENYVMMHIKKEDNKYILPYNKSAEIFFIRRR